MCLIFVAYRAHPRYRLIVAANRDEYHARPAAAAEFWAEAPDLLAGRDLQAGGTWLGITRRGRFAALTNYRHGGDFKAGARSRGLLVSGFLTGAQSAREFLRAVAREGARYNGFSLLLGDPGGMLYYSNREHRIRALPAGIHGLSNALLNTPWPKVTRGKQQLARIASAGGVDSEALLEMMADRTLAPDDALPDTGVPRDWEQQLSAMFIRAGAYGTRSTTVVLVDSSGAVEFAERSFDGLGNAVQTVRRQFVIELPAARDTG